MLTYRNIKAIINQFARSHAQIRNWQKGNPFDVDEVQQVDGAQLVWECSGITPEGKNAAEWSYTLFFMSQVTEVNDKSNSDDVINESILQAMDFVSYLERYGLKGFASEDSNEDIEFQKKWSIAPFEERFNSLYSGAMLTFSLSGSFDYNRCQIPLITEDDTWTTDEGDDVIDDNTNNIEFQENGE